MPLMIRENVERMVSDENVAKMEAAGYRVVDAQNKPQEVKTSEGDKNTEENVNIEPEGTQTVAGAMNEPETVATGSDENVAKMAAADNANTEGNDQNTDYDKMNVQQLRKVAKEMGVQGYANMQRATLLAVIKAH